MKILHISTFDSGGAAIAAFRLHNALLNMGVESKMLVLKKKHNRNGVIHFRAKNSFLKRLFNRFSPSSKGMFSSDVEIFSNPRTRFNILKNPDYIDADIVHLHWVADFLDYPSFFKFNTKPIVWTLHDMNPLCGGVHYINDLRRNEAVLGREERRRYDIKKRSLTSVSKMKIVAPSIWLTEESRKSGLLGRFPHTTVPYGLDLNIFSPFDKNFCRQILGLPKNKKIILFISENVNNKRKGFSLLLDVIRSNPSQDVAYAVVGSISEQIHSDNIFSLGPVVDERLMALAYSSADLFVMPSLEDNFPNVLIESLACGTPIMAFRIGGVPDVIIHGENGILVKEVSSIALGAEMERFLQDRYDFKRDQIRMFAEKHFSQSVQASSYTALYRSLLHDD